MTLQIHVSYPAVGLNLEVLYLEAIHASVEATFRLICAQ